MREAKAPLSQLSLLAGRWLRIRSGESGRVLLAGAASFLVMGGVIFGRSARDALFLKNFGVQNLPYMYVASALVLVGCASVYSGWVDRVGRRRFLAFSFPLFGVLLAASRAVLGGQFRWFYPVLYVLVQAISILSGMLFWTATEELFDTRQAKRLVPVVNLGALLSMIVCGFSTKPLVRILGGSPNLFLAWAAMLVVALFLLDTALRRYPMAGAGRARPTADGRTAWLKEAIEGFRDLKSTRLLRSMAGITLGYTLAIVLVDFQFNQVMTGAYRSQDELTSFLGTFRGLSGFCALLVQVLLTPWLIATFGVGLAIVVMPALMLGATAAMAGSLGYGTSYAARLLDLVFFATVQTSSFQLLYNPLPADRRARMRAFVEGSFRPLLTGIVGLLMVMGNRFLSPRQITLWAVVAVGGWLAASVKVRRGYIEALVENLGAASSAERLSAADALARMKDWASLARLGDAIRTAPIQSVVPAILLLEQFGHPETHVVLVDLLQHPEAKVRATAVAALGRLGNRALLDHLNRLLRDPDPRTRANAVEACLLAEPTAVRDRLEQLLDDPARRVRANAVAVLARLPDATSDELLARVEEMCQSPDTNWRASGAYALGWFPTPVAQPLLLRLLQDPAEQPRAMVMRSLQQVGDSECVPFLLGAAGGSKALRREARGALLAISAREPEKAFRQVVAAMRSNQEEVMRLVAQLLGRLNRTEAFPHLTAVLSEGDPALREEALLAIERLAEHHGLLPEARASLENFAFAELGRLEENLARHQALRVSGDSGETRDAANWLAQELLQHNRGMRQRVLRAAALQYDRGRVREVALGIDDPDSRKRANALEALEYVVPGGLGRKLAQVLEGEGQPGASPGRPRHVVLAELAAHRYPTVRAASVLVAGSGGISECAALVQNSLLDPAPMVRETAVWSAWRLLGPRALARLEPIAQDPDPRVRRAAEIVLGEVAAPPDPLRGSLLLTVEKILFLKSVPLLSSLEGEQLAGVADIAEEIRVEVRRLIFEAGDRSRELYVVVSGRLKVYLGGAGSERVLAELGPRECFGEMALLDSEPRSASVFTLEPCRLLKINEEGFRELLYERPQISMEILKVLSRRLRRMDVEMGERPAAVPAQPYLQPDSV